LKTILLTLFALVAFAGNSVLCRYALKDEMIDASSFTAIRLISGAVFLSLLLIIKGRGQFEWRAGNWSSSLFLFIYTVAFSFAYINLDTGVGALILFGFVQVTMVFNNIAKGNKLRIMEWLGLLVAFSGLVLLLLPSASAPSLFGFILMAISGVAWGFYTLAGKGAVSPTLLTGGNFLRTVPLVILMVLFNLESVSISHEGVLLAVVSGAITSGLGYAVWYAAINGLNITQAAVLQLTVPIIATFGGVLFSNELISIQLLTSSLLVLGGILIVILGNRSKANE